MQKKRWKKSIKLYFSFLIVLSILSISYIGLYYTIPSTICVFKGESRVQRGLLSGDLKYESTSFQNFKAKESKIVMSIAGIPVKKVDVKIVSPDKIKIGGNAFGIKMFTQGVVVVGIDEIESENGYVNPGYEAGIRIQDIILKVNSVPIKTIEQLADIIENCNGKKLKFELMRNNLKYETMVTPVIQKKDNVYKTGIWVRDSTAGIGTMTFYDEKNKIFAGLGHGICDVDTGQLMPLGFGIITPANIVGIKKSENGVPGQLKGVFYSDTALGKIYSNSDRGLYGILTDEGVKKLCGDEYKIAMTNEIKCGKAQIISTINGEEKKLYDINIDKVNNFIFSGDKNMDITITDKVLLEKTGGIVQGMSGSPIIQNGKIIGAITHVLISNTNKGYAISAEKMYKTAVESIKNSNVDKIAG